MTKACEAVVSQVRNDGFECITATHDIKNSRSGEVMKRLGLAYKYSYVEQWQPQNIDVTLRMYQRNFAADNAMTYLKY